MEESWPITIAYGTETYEVPAETATWIGENFYQGWGEDEGDRDTARALGLMIEKALVDKDHRVELEHGEAVFFANYLDKWALRNEEPRALCDWLMKVTHWPGH